MLCTIIVLCPDKGVHQTVYIIRFNIYILIYLDTVENNKEVEYEAETKGEAEAEVKVKAEAEAEVIAEPEAEVEVEADAEAEANAGAGIDAIETTTVKNMKVEQESSTRRVEGGFQPVAGPVHEN